MGRLLCNVFWGPLFPGEETVREAGTVRSTLQDLGRRPPFNHERGQHPCIHLGYMGAEVEKIWGNGLAFVTIFFVGA